ncbi:MAG: hypothetical protein M1453_08340 [Acidobacteria bacterium]|nr:hypothetical protein [Acidobacteriota bacterium]MCL5287984.1 hypothetical protein [Acidobacteriota bacterium]
MGASRKRNPAQIFLCNSLNFGVIRESDSGKIEGHFGLHMKVEKRNFDALLKKLLRSAPVSADAVRVNRKARPAKLIAPTPQR